jgi:hypothetical protein
MTERVTESLLEVRKSLLLFNKIKNYFAKKPEGAVARKVASFGHHRCLGNITFVARVQVVSRKMLKRAQLAAMTIPCMQEEWNALVI